MIITEGTQSAKQPAQSVSSGPTYWKDGVQVDPISGKPVQTVPASTLTIDTQQAPSKIQTISGGMIYVDPSEVASAVPQGSTVVVDIDQIKVTEPTGVTQVYNTPTQQDIDTLQSEADKANSSVEQLNRDIDTFNKNPEATESQQTELTKRIEQTQREVNGIQTRARITNLLSESRNNEALTRPTRQIVESSAVAAKGLWSSVWQGLTPWKEEKGQTIKSYGIAKAVGVMAAEIIVPGVYLGRHWDELSPHEKAAFIGLDVLSLVPLLGTAVKVSGKAAQLARTGSIGLKEARTAVRTARAVDIAQAGLKKASESFKPQELSKGIDQVYKSARMQKAIQAAKIADIKFINAMKNVTTISDKQLNKIERLSGVKGLSDSLLNVGKQEKRLSSGWKELEKLKVGTPEYTKKITEIQGTRVSYQKALASLNEKVAPLYHIGKDTVLLTPTKFEKVVQEPGGNWVKKTFSTLKGTGTSEAPELVSTQRKGFGPLRNLLLSQKGELRWPSEGTEVIKQLAFDPATGKTITIETVVPKATKRVLSYAEPITANKSFMDLWNRTFAVAETKTEVSASKIARVAEMSTDDLVKEATFTKPITITKNASSQLTKGLATHLAKSISESLALHTVALSTTQVLKLATLTDQVTEIITKTIIEIEAATSTSQLTRIITSAQTRVAELTKDATQSLNKTKEQQQVATETKVQTQTQLKQAVDLALKTKTGIAIKDITEIKKSKRFRIRKQGGEEIELSKSQLEGSYFWRQGFVWKLWVSPFSDSPITIIERPPYAKEASGPGSAQRSLTESGISKGTPALPMGIVSIQVVNPKHGKSKLVYRRLPNKARKAISEVQSSR